MRVNAGIGISLKKSRASLIITIALLIRFSLPAQTFNTKAAFIPNAFTTYLSSGGQIKFKNNSLNSDTYSWDFGDGSEISYEKHPIYRYDRPGIFNVKLITKNKFGADSMDIMIVVVDDKSTGAIHYKNESQIGFTYNSLTETYNVNLDFSLMKDVCIWVNDLSLGQVREQTYYAVLTADIPIDVRHFSPGAYLVTVRTQDDLKRTFKIIK